MCASLTRVLSVRGVEQVMDKGEEVGRVDGERERERERKRNLGF